MVRSVGIPPSRATLSYNGTAFLTLSSPSYSSVDDSLVFSGTLPNDVIIPSGATITYTISNNVSGTAFHVNYDSTNNPSKISLPAGNVIHVNSLVVYDAPYPGGNLVTRRLLAQRFMFVQMSAIHLVTTISRKLISRPRRRLAARQSTRTSQLRWQPTRRPPHLNSRGKRVHRWVAMVLSRPQTKVPKVLPTSLLPVSASSPRTLERPVSRNSPAAPMEPRPIISTQMPAFVCV